MTVLSDMEKAVTLFNEHTDKGLFRTTNDAFMYAHCIFKFLIAFVFFLFRTLPKNCTTGDEKQALAFSRCGVCGGLSASIAKADGSLFKEANCTCTHGIPNATAILPHYAHDMNDFIYRMKTCLTDHRFVAQMYETYIRLWSKMTDPEKKVIREDSQTKKILRDVVHEYTAQLRGTVLYYRSSTTDAKQDSSVIQQKIKAERELALLEALLFL